MHTVLMLGGGIALLAALIVLGRALGLSIGMSSLLFVPLWFIASAVNMWIGVTRAGYTAAEEFPIFIGVFGLPTMISLIIWWRHSAR